MDRISVRNGSILRVLRGARLPCGCMAGIYETYTGTTALIIDDAHPNCRLADHRNGYMMVIEARQGSRQDTWTS